VLADVRRGTWRPPPPDPVVDEPRSQTFHEFSSAWVERRREEVEPRTIEYLKWALSSHLLPRFAGTLLSAITVERVDEYREAKLRERTLSHNSINTTIQVLAQVLDQAQEYGHIDANPARGKRRRLKSSKPRRTWLELDEVRALLDAAGEHRALLATMTLAGLRVGEAVALRWSDTDLARGRISVRKAKTDAGHRVVDLSPDLLDELKLHRAASRSQAAEDLVFTTSRGTPRDRHNVRSRILAGAIERANVTRGKSGLPPLTEGVTNHTLRRTFASLLYEAGASPAYVMSQMGHTSSALALEVYARKMQRSRDTGARMDALIRGAEWAPMGTNGAVPADLLIDKATETAS